MNSKAGKSVVTGIVTYNTDIDTLVSTLLSLLSSEHPTQIIVLCNSPSEIYQQEVMSHCARLGVLCMHHMPNNGFGAGHNSIAKLAACDWYICCNPDVTVSPATIGRLLTVGIKNKDAVLIAPRVIYPDGRNQPLVRRHLTITTWIHRQLWRIFPGLFKPYEIAFDYELSQSIEFVSGCFFLISKKKFLELDGFDEDFFLYVEDADLSLRASLIGKNYYVAESKVVHLWSTDFRRNPRSIWLELRALGFFFRKHRPRLGLYSKS